MSLNAGISDDNADSARLLIHLMSSINILNLFLSIIAEVLARARKLYSSHQRNRCTFHPLLELLSHSPHFGKPSISRVQSQNRISKLRLRRHSAVARDLLRRSRFCLYNQRLLPRLFHRTSEPLRPLAQISSQLTSKRKLRWHTEKGTASHEIFHPLLGRPCSFLNSGSR